MMSSPLLLTRKNNFIGFLKDLVSGGKAGFPLYPLQDITSFSPSDTINVIFTGASTGHTEDNYRLDILNILRGRGNNQYQMFRWGDLDKAIQWAKKRPHGSKLRVIGYSHGADPANLFARIFKAPVSQIDPVTRKPNNYVSWTKYILPSNRGEYSTLNNFISHLGGRYPEASIPKDKKLIYEGLHCFGVNQATVDELCRLPIQPTLKLLLFERKRPTLLINKAYKYSPYIGAGLGFGAGYGISQLAGVKSILWKIVNGGVGAAAMALAAPKIVDYLVPKFKG